MRDIRPRTEYELFKIFEPIQKDVNKQQKLKKLRLQLAKASMKARDAIRDVENENDAQLKLNMENIKLDKIVTRREIIKKINKLT